MKSAQRLAGAPRFVPAKSALHIILEIFAVGLSMCVVAALSAYFAYNLGKEDGFTLGKLSMAVEKSIKQTTEGQGK